MLLLKAFWKILKEAVSVKIFPHQNFALYGKIYKASYIAMHIGIVHSSFINNLHYANFPVYSYVACDHKCQQIHIIIITIIHISQLAT